MMRKYAFVVLVAAVLLLPLPAAGELSVALYAGRQITGNGDLQLKQGSTDLTFHDVSWDDRSFESPVYYGARVTYWFEDLPGWGAAVDFSHAKTYLAEDDIVTVTGSRNGAAVNGQSPVSADIEHFSLSHGLNMLTINGLYRWLPGGRRDLSPVGRLQFYAGLGAGFSIPHVEAKINGVTTGEYQVAAGPVVNGMAGINYDLTRSLSGMLEYKASYADVHARLNGGGTIDAATLNHQVIFGLAANFSLW